MNLVSQLIESATSRVLEKISLPGESSINSYMQQVADAYGKAPSMDRAAVTHWTALSQHTDKVLYPKIEAQLKKIYREKNPEFKTNPNGGGFIFEPHHTYKTAEEMSAEVLNKGVFRVSTADSEHPVWNLDQNVRFRAVHDWYTHIINKAPFNARGEIRAYNTYVKLIPPNAVPAAFTEIVGQVSYAIINGGFGEQKVCLLPQFDYVHLGKMNPKFQEQQPAPQPEQTS